MTDRPYNVLVLCTGNSARSILGEALFNTLGRGRFRAWSAGSHPTGQVQPIAAELAGKLGYDTAQLRSKCWDAFTGPDAPALDFVITVCDNAAGESCPLWRGTPVTAHWGVPDPAAVEGDEATRRHAYLAAMATLRKRVELLAALPIDKLDRLTLQQEARAIGREMASA